MQLAQNGPVVSGCYDSAGDLNGTVSGNILRATGFNRSDKTPSAFILSVAADGGLRGVRSTNRGPFRLYTLAAAPAGSRVDCGDPAPPALGCGSIIHSITFGFDSAEIRPESAAVLAELLKGLQSDPSAKVVIEGHTSSEGTEDYNNMLSERRAQAVVADLVRRGVQAAAVDRGGDRRAASDRDERRRERPIAQPARRGEVSVGLSLRLRVSALRTGRGSQNASPIPRLIRHLVFCGSPSMRSPSSGRS